jgi:hypothetical protein
MPNNQNRPLRIDATNPLSSGMVAAYSARAGGGRGMPNLIGLRSEDYVQIAGDAVFRGADVGHALTYPNSGSYTGATALAPHRSLKPASAVSVFWCGTINSGGTLTSNPPLISMWYDNADGDPYIAYGLHRPASGAGHLAVFYNNGTFQSLSVTDGINTSRYGLRTTIGFTRRGGSTKLYVNGRLWASDTVAAGSGITYGATANLRMGSHLITSTSNPSASHDIAYIWDREVTADEFRLLDLDSYEPFARAPRRKFTAFGIAPPPATSKAYYYAQTQGLR